MTTSKGFWPFYVFFTVGLRAGLLVDVLSMPLYMPTVLWDPRNPLFNCPSRNINTILVKSGDYMNFLCPVTNSNFGLQESNMNHNKLHEIAYFVHPEKMQDALTCNVTGYSHFLKCNQPTSSLGRTIRIAQASGDSTAPLFQPGKTYYMIGTGNGEALGITNQVGGRCNYTYTNPEKTYKMILKIKVCSNDEVTNNKCKICRTVGCYNKGCGTYNGWQNWQNYRDVSNMTADASINGLVKNAAAVAGENLCFKERQRTCKDDISGCDGPKEQTELSSCPNIHVTSNFQNCTAWVTLSEVFRNNSNHCFTRKHQNCTVGNLEKTVITRWEMENATCPTTTPAPAVAGGWSSWQDFNHGSFKFEYRTCTNPHPRHGGATCSGNHFKDMTWHGKKVAASTGSNIEVNYKSYVIPVVTAILGTAIGAAAVYFHIRHKQKVHSRDAASKAYETESCHTLNKGIENNGYSMDTIKSTKIPLEDSPKDRLPPVNQA